MLGSDPKWALRVLRQIIDDVRDGKIDSRDLNKASDIEKYFSSLPKNLQPQNSKSRRPRPFKDIDVKQRPARAVLSKSATNPKTKSAPRPRATLAPRRHTFNTPNSAKGEALLREASNLDADRFPISAAFVLRSFVELAINDYMEIHKLPKVEQNKKGERVDLDLNQRADRVVTHIVAADSSKNADLRGFRNNIMTKTSPTSIQSLSGFVHNKFQIPTADAIRTGWECAVPIFIATYGNP